jgi:murein DD-endopeptidase MepM/ murein hydrolase activator NlpD
MRLGQLKLASACAVGLCAVAGEAVAESPSAPILEQPNGVGSATASKKSGALPTGNSDAFRTRLLSWSGPPAEISTTMETIARVSRPRLYISSPFGWRSDPIKGNRRHHAGIDLPGPPMTLVHATGAGIVRIAGRAGGYGNLVEIEHSGRVRTRYGHLSRVLVRPGAAVAQGDVIGQMGSTGRSTGTHLHYEVRVNGVPANPLDYMGQTAPSHHTTWAPETPVTPRWAGWAESIGGRSLPEARIR